MKEEIRKYKWVEGEKGRKLTWKGARQEWTEAYREKYEKFLIDTLSFPGRLRLQRSSATEKQEAFPAGVTTPAIVPYRSG